MNWPWKKNRKPRHYAVLLDQFGVELTNHRSFEGRVNMAELIFKPVRERAVATEYRISTGNGVIVTRNPLPEPIELRRNERPRVPALSIRIDR